MNHPALRTALLLAVEHLDEACKYFDLAFDHADLDDLADLHHIVDLDKIKHTTNRVRGVTKELGEPVS